MSLHKCVLKLKMLSILKIRPSCYTVSRAFSTSNVQAMVGVLLLRFVEISLENFINGIAVDLPENWLNWSSGVTCRRAHSSVIILFTQRS